MQEILHTNRWAQVFCDSACHQEAQWFAPRKNKGGCIMKSKIEIRKKTKSGLKKYGDKDSTWDQIIMDLLNHVSVCDRYWEDKE